MPLSIEAFDQYCELHVFMQVLHPANSTDSWSYIWGTRNYSPVKAYIFFHSAPYPQMDLENQMSSKTQGLLLVAF
jgi:hypothetical protein